MPAHAVDTPHRHPSTSPTAPSRTHDSDTEAWTRWSNVTGLPADGPRAAEIRAVLDATWLRDAAAPVLTRSAKHRVLGVSSHLAGLRDDLTVVDAARVTRALGPLAAVAGTTPHLTWLQLGCEIQRLRLRAGIHARDAAAELGWEPCRFTALEVGHHPLDTDDRERLVRLLGEPARAVLDPLRVLARDVPQVCSEHHHAEILASAIVSVHQSSQDAIDMLLRGAGIPPTILHAGENPHQGGITADSLTAAVPGGVHTLLARLRDMPEYPFGIVDVPQSRVGGCGAVVYRRG